MIQELKTASNRVKIAAKALSIDPVTCERTKCLGWEPHGDGVRLFFAQDWIDVSDAELREYHLESLRKE